MNDELKQSKRSDQQPSRGGKRLAPDSRGGENRPRHRKSAAVAQVPERARTQERQPRQDRPVRERQPRQERPAQTAAAVAVKTARAWWTGVGNWMRQTAERWQTTEGADSPALQAYRATRKELKRARRRWRHIVREKRARHFPESERMMIQLLLFGWGMLPALASTLREATWGRRKRAINRVAQARGWFEQQRIHPAAFLGAGCALAVVALFVSTYTVGTTVTFDGEQIATVASRDTAEQVRANLERVTTRTLGETYTIDDTQIQYASGLMRRQDVVGGNTFEEELSQEIGLVTPAYCLYVDGEFIGATPYEGALEQLLEQLKSAATGADTISCSFAEKVEIKNEYIPKEKVVNLGYLAETLYSTKSAEVNYTVVKGDTWSQIAKNHDLSSKELLALNPGFNVDKLQIGEVLTLSASVPYLTMTVVQRERYLDDVPFNIEYTDSGNLYKGDYKVTSPGEYGAADVVANVTYINGEEVERTILSSVTLENPVTEQRLQGTKERPNWLPTGTFRWPITGRITSRFGGRSSPGGVGSTNHKGIDIAGRRGNPVYAADGGTVTYSGWMGGYGYLVRISHGNGYETLYGHNSSLVVSVGQHVYKGQQIARVGSTGNSTGNHCHFEVRYNGVSKNPLNYLP